MVHGSVKGFRICCRRTLSSPVPRTSTTTSSLRNPNTATTLEITSTSNISTSCNGNINGTPYSQSNSSHNPVIIVENSSNNEITPAPNPSKGTQSIWVPLKVTQGLTPIPATGGMYWKLVIDDEERISLGSIDAVRLEAINPNGYVNIYGLNIFGYILVD